MDVELAFRFPNGKVTKIHMNTSQTVLEAKMKLAALTNNSEQNIELIYKSRELRNEKTLAQSLIKESDVIRVIIKPSKPKPKPIVQHPTPKEQSTEARGQLPPRKCEYDPSKSEDPPNFENSVDILEQFGFERELCKKALRAAFYCLDRAADYLFSDSIPEELPADVQELNKQRDELCKDYSPENIERRSIPLLNQKPDLTPDDINNLEQLKDLGFPMDLVVQCYDACQHDLQQTAFCLTNIKDDEDKKQK